MSVDISAIPELLGEALSITTLGGQLLCSVAVLITVIAITAIFTRDTIVLILMSFMGLTICIALEWLDYFFLVFAGLIVALLYARQISNILSGG